MLKKLFAAALLAASLALTSNAPAQPEPSREFRAVWVATVYKIDWPINGRNSVSQQQADLRSLLDRAKASRMNAIVFQIRPSGDAFYQSSLEPWSAHLTGAEGVPPSPLWDPLAFAIAECRARGMELHAWINPYRAKTGTYSHGTLHASNRGLPTYRYPSTQSSIEWFDPGSQAVQDHAAAVVQDVLRRYDVDGIHFDDYFYPYPASDETTGQSIPFPDSATYAAYQSGGGTLSLANWRRNNVNVFIQRIQTLIRTEKPHVKFGLSPFGIWRPGNPSGITGLDAYSTLYADSRRWLNEGWVDYLAPQLYWEIADAGQEFPKLLDWWISQNTRSRHVWPGITPSRIKSHNWPSSEIVNQILEIRGRAGSTGHIHFSENALKSDFGSIQTTLRNGLYAKDALVPATPWLDAVLPPPPTVTATRATPTSAWVLNWVPAAGESAVLWTVQYRLNGVWETFVLPGTARSYTLPGGGAAANPDAAAVRSVDFVKNVSTPAAANLNPMTAQGMLAY